MSEDETLRAAARGQIDPSSLTDDEIRAIALMVLEREGYQVKPEAPTRN